MAQAASIQSMTIAEIGSTSGGLGTSSERGGGGYISASLGSASLGSASFVSLGSADGALLMGETQGAGDFSNGFLWQNQTAYLTTLNGAPSGTITNTTLTLDLSGLTGEWNNISFNGAPDPGTLVTSASLIGNGVTSIRRTGRMSSPPTTAYLHRITARSSISTWKALRLPSLQHRFRSLKRTPCYLRGWDYFVSRRIVTGSRLEHQR